MDLRARLRTIVKTARRRGASWVRILELVRLSLTSEGRSILWTMIVHRDSVHQTTPFTSEERYSTLFELAAALAPGSTRLLSFGCSTGEELVALRRRFPEAEILGAEINPRSRKLAARRIGRDRHARVVPPDRLTGKFDVIFAMAVLQREPHKIQEMGVTDLTPYYPFERFDAAVRFLVGLLSDGGLLCITHAQYRVEDSAAAAHLEPIPSAPLSHGFFGTDGRTIGEASGCTMFRKDSKRP